ncbi:phosphatidylserine decarboxylase [Snodgrassella sp. CFCC 13594]|uniref:phosphatidylserine decarboxylase n=1 Tax=Snodgrassella sp. CFCC 13594 TaxID=1775559 RepID=UPI00082B733F|nr:phosphatidylserine decarboxylase [Snodgrassella sp. CFCC 13594]
MARFYPHPVIAIEGWPFIIGSVIISVLATLFAGWWSLPLWLLTAFVVQFFRDPAREIPNDPQAILSPADGRIVVVEKTTDPYRAVPALKISVFMNVFNVHSNRSPIDGVVERVDYFKGSFLNAAVDKASVQNERNAVLAVTRSGRPVTFVQVAGLVARRILCYVRAEDSLRRGERYGFIRFGSRVDVYLPEDATPLVAIGDKVSASSTVLASLPLSAPIAEPNPANVDGQNTAIVVGQAADQAHAAAQQVLQQP